MADPIGASEESPPSLRIGEWTVDPSSGELRHGDHTVRLEPKHMAVLLHLAQRDGALVSKEELFDNVWTDAVVGDKALVRCIAGLRKAFGDDPQQPRYIETLHRRGYRLIAPVSQATPSAGDLAPPTAANPDHRRRIAWLGGLAGVLALVLLGSLAARQPEQAQNHWTDTASTLPAVVELDIPVAGPDFAVIAAFENLTAQDRLDSLATVFRIGLEQSHHLGVIPDSRLRGALARMERPTDTIIDRQVGLELSRREGADYLILGQSALIGGVFSLSAVVVDPQTDQTLATTEARASSEAELLPTLDELICQIRRDLGESPTKQSPPLERVTTPHLAALEAYTLGREVWGRGHFEEAATHYQSALEIDPDFAMARIALGLGYLSAERPEGRPEIERALASADRLPLFEQLYGRAWLAMVDFDYAESVRLWDLLAKLFPENAVGEYNLGLTHGTYGGNAELAAATMGRAASRLGPAFNLRPALFELRLGNVDRALTLLGPQSDPPSRGLTGYQVLIQLAAERQSQAVELLERPELWHGEDRAWGWFFYHLDQGRIPEALEALEEVQPPRPGSYSQMHGLVARAQVQHLAGEVDGAQITANAQTVLQHADEIAELGNSPVPMMVVLGTLAARGGELAVARDLLARAGELSQGGAPTHLALIEALAGEVLAAQGRHLEAIARFRGALERAENLQAIEGLARSHQAIGQSAEATQLFEDLVARRAQAFGECFELRYYCIGLEANILRWNEARSRLAERVEGARPPTEAE
ncbi:MAG: winged helix-turn-helix domain-containing protein [Acidobacteriota bacterium]